MKEEFISKEEKQFRFKLGTTLASALTGFICGFAAAMIAFYVYVQTLR